MDPLTWLVIGLQYMYWILTNFLDWKSATYCNDTQPEEITEEKWK